MGEEPIYAQAALWKIHSRVAGATVSTHPETCSDSAWSDSFWLKAGPKDLMIDFFEEGVHGFLRPAENRREFQSFILQDLILGVSLK